MYSFHDTNDMLFLYLPQSLLANQRPRRLKTVRSTWNVAVDGLARLEPPRSRTARVRSARLTAYSRW